MGEFADDELLLIWKSLFPDECLNLIKRALNEDMIHPAELEVIELKRKIVKLEKQIWLLQNKKIIDKPHANCKCD